MGGTRTSIATALSAATAAILLAGCGSKEPAALDSTVGTDAPKVGRAVEPGKLVAGLNEFGLDYLRLLNGSAPGKNVVFSPLSIGMAFGMAEAGAQGETADQIADVFGFPGIGQDLHATFGALDRMLSDSGKSTVRLANRMYPRIDYPLVEDFVNTLADEYNAPLERLDFQGDADGSRQRINEWVAERTEDRIEELLPPDFIEPRMVLVLVNALYLEAKWSQPFGKEATAPAPFTLLAGSTVDAPLMHNPELHTRYLDSEVLQAVEIPYGEGELSMLVLLPEEGTFAEFERGLDALALAGIDERMREGIVDLALPRWKSDFKVDLLPTLEQLGLTDLTNFSGISPENPFLGKGVHAATIDVDERGTVAAAATALGFLESAAPTPDAEIRADRPFLYLIRDTKTGTIMFAGRVIDPTA